MEDADTPRVVFEERINHLRDFSKTLDGLYDTFLTARAAAGWTGVTTKIRAWIGKNTHNAT